MNPLHIFLFGPLWLEWNQQPYKLAGLPKISALLAFLLLPRAHPLERAQVAFTLWADDSEANARANLRRHLHDLKRALPQNNAWILSDAETVQWNNAAPFWCDVAEFEIQTTDSGQRKMSPALMQHHCRLPSRCIAATSAKICMTIGLCLHANSYAKNIFPPSNV